MHLLLTFLALLTGFSAAQAARPVEATSPTSTASQLDLAEAVAIAAVANATPSVRGEIQSSTLSSETMLVPTAVLAIVASTPVSRADRARN